ncbi:hypothetical protein C8J56DRAFT_1029996 [Mycena floridula]|nr:hypothetical protein C8J56DRAFT_1029996 [Mycena floridula]
MSNLACLAQVLTLIQQEKETSPQPSITVFNLEDGKHVHFTPDWTSADEKKHESLLELFAGVLETVRKRGYVVHSATYSAQVAQVFVETDEAMWYEKCSVTARVFTLASFDTFGPTGIAQLHPPLRLLQCLTSGDRGRPDDGKYESTPVGQNSQLAMNISTNAGRKSQVTDQAIGMLQL